MLCFAALLCSAVATSSALLCSAVAAAARGHRCGCLHVPSAVLCCAGANTSASLVLTPAVQGSGHLTQAERLARVLRLLYGNLNF